MDSPAVSTTFILFSKKGLHEYLIQGKNSSFFMAIAMVHRSKNETELIGPKQTYPIAPGRGKAWIPRLKGEFSTMI